MAFPFSPLGLYSIVCELVGYFMFFLGVTLEILNNTKFSYL